MRLADMFSGIGIAAMGLVQAGFRHTFGVDIDARARLGYMINHRVPAEYADLSSPKAMLKVMRRHGVNSRYDGLVWLSSPCQGFSLLRGMSSEGINPSDPRNSLLMRAADAAEAMPRSWVVLENVAGLLCKHGLPYHETLVTRLREIGRSPITWKLDAADYGVAQTRNRVFVVAPPCSFKRELAPPPKQKRLVLRDAIHPTCFVDRYPEAEPLTRLNFAIYSQIQAGQNWKASSIGRDFAQLMFGKQGEQVPDVFLSRLSWDKPAPCLSASMPRGFSFRGQHVHPDDMRHLSVGERMELMGMPKSMIVTGDMAEKLRQIGNGVPVPLAKAVGEAILRVT